MDLFVCLCAYIITCFRLGYGWNFSCSERVDRFACLCYVFTESLLYSLATQRFIQYSVVVVFVLCINLFRGQNDRIEQ